MLAGGKPPKVYLALAGGTGFGYVSGKTEFGNPVENCCLGNSLIVSHTGWPLAGPASADREEMLFADLNLADARRKRTLNEFNQLLRDRRTDLYGEMLGTAAKPGWY